MPVSLVAKVSLLSTDDSLGSVLIRGNLKSGNLVWHRSHEKGGHFSAMELPEQFVQDMEDFVKEVWPKAKDA